MGRNLYEERHPNEAKFRLTKNGWERLVSSADAVNLSVSETSKEVQMLEEDVRRRVFVVHGRNTGAKDELCTFLRSIDLYVVEWEELAKETRKGAPYTGQVLDQAFNQEKIQAVVVLLTGDDEGRLLEPFRKDSDPEYEHRLTPQPRQNVIFEAGRAFGSHPDKTVLVKLGEIRGFSDIAGINYVELDNTGTKRQVLANRLRTAGCLVNTDGTAWHTAGDFERMFLFRPLLLEGRNRNKINCFFALRAVSS